MPDISHTTSGQETVVDYATVNLKESFAVFFNSWGAAIERTDDDLEHVHELRVSSRRVKAALELFAEFLPARKAERLLQRLDNVRKSAGAARDGDVFLERLESTYLDHQAKKVLLGYLKRQRANAHASFESYYKKCDRGEQLERQAVDLLTCLRPRRGSQSPTEPLDKWVRDQLRSVSREFIADADVDTEHLECLHQFRIRSKQFRYSLELLQPAVPVDRLKKVSSDLKKLSQRLGEINDHATAIETLSNLLEVDFSKNVRRMLRRWRKDERRTLKHAIAQFADWWTSRRRRRMRRHLKHATRIAKKTSVTE